MQDISNLLQQSAIEEILNNMESSDKETLSHEISATPSEEDTPLSKENSVDGEPPRNILKKACDCRASSSERDVKS